MKIMLKIINLKKFIIKIKKMFRIKLKIEENLLLFTIHVLMNLIL